MCVLSSVALIDAPASADNRGTWTLIADGQVRTSTVTLTQSGLSSASCGDTNLRFSATIEYTLTANNAFHIRKVGLTNRRTAKINLTFIDSTMNGQNISAGTTLRVQGSGGIGNGVTGYVSGGGSGSNLYFQQSGSYGAPNNTFMSFFVIPDNSSSLCQEYFGLSYNRQPAPK